MRRRKLLYSIADGWPTDRPDVLTLFGKELVRHGITCDLVAQCSRGAPDEVAPWPAGAARLCPRTGSRIRDQLLAFWHDCRTLLKARAADYDAIQVRDKVFAGVFGLLCARWQRLPFFYWMSFPMSEGFIDLARRHGRSLGTLRWLFVTTKGYLGKYLIYRLLLPHCDHVFVQSERMASDLAERGIRPGHVTAVPMGVDLERLTNLAPAPGALSQQLAGRRVIGWLGALDRTRRVDFLFEVLATLRAVVPDLCLLLVGDAQEEADRRWLRREAEKLHVADAIVWTGWVSPQLAWACVRRAEVAVSILPRGELFDWASPTKVVEYLALGLPVVANDQPDQRTVLEESGAGLSVAMTVQDFAAAILRLLHDKDLAAAMSDRGPEYVGRQRSYALLGEQVAEVYRALLPAA
jgi:glycosyltransferase involved in cell wall biosynthesis